MKTNRIKWHIEKRELSSLRGWEKNPRILSDKGMADLKKSIDKFGLAEPIVIQPDGLIIGGHARYRALVESGEKNGDCYVPEKPLTDKQVQELNIRLNKNIAGEFDFKKLADKWDIEELREWGFEDWEFGIPSAVDTESQDQPDETIPKTLTKCPQCGHEF